MHAQTPLSFWCVYGLTRLVCDIVLRTARSLLRNRYEDHIVTALVLLLFPSLPPNGDHPRAAGKL
jgi:hypothetical protein